MFLSLATAAIWSLPSNALALSIIFDPGTQGQVTINAPAGANTFNFDSTNVNTGFKLPEGYTVSGTVSLAGGGGIVGLGADIVNLTNFTVTRPANVQGGTLVIDFLSAFQMPPAPPPQLFSAASIFGSEQNAGGTVGGITLQYFASVIDSRNPKVNFPIGTSVQVFGGPLVSPSPFAGGLNGIIAANSGAVPPWTLQGELRIALSGVGDTVVLPNSAEVGLSDQPLTTIPEPASLTLLSLGLLGVLGYGRHHRKRARA